MNITVEKIKQCRAEKKASGARSCITGEDVPLYSLKGISWRPDDPMNPGCFCHDCRSTWDPDGSIDLELIKNGHKWACHAYSAILPDKKETYRDLRRRSDDALEDFVRTQVALAAKLSTIKDFEDKIANKESSYSNMTRGKSYEFMKRNESEIDGITDEIRKLRKFKSYHEKDVPDIEAQCRKTEQLLADARKEEREFFDNNF